MQSLMRCWLGCLLVILTSCSAIPQPEARVSSPTSTQVADATPNATRLPSVMPETATPTTDTTTSAEPDMPITGLPPTPLPAGTQASPTITPLVIPPAAREQELLPRIEVAPIDASVPPTFKNPEGEAFADFRLPRVQEFSAVTMDAPALDLGNVQVPVLLSPQQQTLLAQNGFVVSPGDAREFYEVYERARYNYQPAFITSDSVLHAYHLIFNRILRRTEVTALAPMLTALDRGMLQTSLAYYELLDDPQWSEAALQNAAYFAVAVKLLEPDWELPDLPDLRAMVEADLASIAAQSGYSPSAVYPDNNEDWTQYIPRGHYTRSAELQRYFQAMMWHGRISLPRQTPAHMLLVTLALQQTMVEERPALDLWEGIYEPTTFFVGESDEITPVQVWSVIAQVYGPSTDVQELDDPTKLERFQAEIALLDTSIITSTKSPLMPDEDPLPDVKFMGQRVVPDTTVFERLVNPHVPERLLPKGLDFFAVLGSERARAHLAATGDADTDAYQENMAQLRTIFASYDEDIWTQNLYWSWIYGLRSLLEPVEGDYPQFMLSDAWSDKQLHTALGSWSQLKHDTVLYTEQVYVEGGAVPPPPLPELPKGYVEPVPEFYARITALSEMTRDGLAVRGILNPEEQRLLEQMIELTTRLQALAEKQLRAEPLTEEEYRFIHRYGIDLERLTLAAAADERSDRGIPTGEPPEAAIITDIATDLTRGGSVLQTGVGRVFDIYAIVPVDGQLVVARGGVFSHYEFVQPVSERLTNETWREMLNEDQAPPQAAWTNSFIVHQRVEQPLADTILEFNDDLVNAFWFVMPSGSMPVEDGNWDITQYLSGAELEDTVAFIERLQQRQESIGMKRLSIVFRSFDFQGERQATVATRESWEEQLYSGTPLLGQTPIGERSYTADVTYTMEQQDEQWTITKIVITPDPPGWSAP